MFEGLLEFVLKIMFSPFEPRIDSIMEKINRKYGKFLRILIKAVMLILSLLIIVGIIALISFAVRGYWL